MIRMVALDIDGTLLKPGVESTALPDAQMTAAVHDLHEAGIVVALATGRMYPGTVHIADHLGINQPLICQQVASVHDYDGSLRHGCSIDEDIAMELYEFATAHGWPLAWFDSVRYLVTEPSRQAQYFADVSQVDIEVHPQPFKSGVLATGIDIISTVEASRDVHVLLEARYGGRITLLDFPSVTAVHAPEASKGNALHTLADELGIARGEVLAIGDSVNDVSMLSWAGHSAAPGHCDRYARDSAKEILSGEGVDGVVAKLRSLLE
jgi:Cof subfamily protein (haloacid dehalogenase superfamily)